MIPASFLSYTNLNGLHSNMKLFCPGDGDGLLAAAPRYTHSPDQTSHFEIWFPHTCAAVQCGDPGLFMETRCFHGWKQEENRPKWPNGVSCWTASRLSFGIIQINQGLEYQNLNVRGGGSPLPGCWMHPIPGVSNHTDLFLATGIPKWFHYLAAVDRRDECGDVLSAGSSAAVLSVLPGRRVSSGGGQTCTRCLTRYEDCTILAPSLCRKHLQMQSHFKNTNKFFPPAELACLSAKTFNDRQSYWQNHP